MGAGTPIGIPDPLILPDPAGSCIGTASVVSESGDPCLLASASLLAGETWAWGALDYQSGTFESNSGSYSLTVIGNEGSGYYLSVTLDTANLPESDDQFPSFGSFNPLTDVPPPVIPIPAAVWLFGSALGLLGWVRRKTS